MQQVKVHVIHAKVLEGCIDTFLGRIVAVILQPELACNKDFVALDTRIADGLAYIAFIHIGGCRIDMSVPRLECVQHGTVSFATVRNHEYAKSHCRNFDTVVQPDSFHNTSPFL